MIVVIQCAARKRAGAGHFQTADGAPLDFVAHPEEAPPGNGRTYARPDDRISDGLTWREVLKRYNEEAASENPLGLYPAYKLYENAVYDRLVDRFGPRKVYILSAGWGLIPSQFLTPYYDITFSQSADAYKRRRPGDLYDDFALLRATDDDEIVFFGGKDYLSFFCRLTTDVKSRRTIFYNSAQRPDAPGCRLRRFDTRTRTNWHYECVSAFLADLVAVD